MNHKKAIGSLSAAFRSLKRQYDALFKDKAELQSKYNVLAQQDPQLAQYIDWVHELNTKVKQLTSRLQDSEYSAQIARDRFGLWRRALADAEDEIKSLKYKLMLASVIGLLSTTVLGTALWLYMLNIRVF
jgi:septation ring formation regulator EzrA